MLKKLQMMAVISICTMMSFLASCGQPAVTTETSTPMAVNTNIPTMALPTATQKPTILPSPTTTQQVFEGVTKPSAKISPANASQLTQLAYWGNDYIDQISSSDKISYSPDGKYFVVVSTIGIYFFNATTYQEYHFYATKYQPTEIRFSSDGRKFIYSSVRKNKRGYGEYAYNLTIINMADWSEVKTIYLDQGLPGGLHFEVSPDLSVIAQSLETGLDFPTINLISTSSGEMIHSFTNDVWYEAHFQFSPNGNYFAYNNDDSVFLWDVKKQKQIYSFSVYGDVDNIIFSPDGKLLVAATGSVVHIWDISTGELIDSDIIGSSKMSFSPDSKYITSASTNGSVSEWEVPTGKLVSQSEITSDWFQLAISPDGEQIASLDINSQIQIWDTFTGKAKYSLEQFTQDEMKYLEFSSDSNKIIVSDGEGNVTFRDIQSGTISSQIHLDDFMIGSIVYSPDKRMIGFEGSEEIYICDAKTDEITQTLDGFSPFAFSPDGKLIAAANDANSVAVWNVADGQFLFSVGDMKAKGISSLAFSPDGKTLAVGAFPWATIYLWDTSNGELITSFKTYGDITGIIFLPQENTILTGRYDGSLIFMDAATGSQKNEIVIPGMVTYAISPDGSLMAIAYPDGTLAVWDTTSWKLLVKQREDTMPIYDISFSPDGTMLATVSDDGILRFWGIPPQ
jgi:WD40 repeat protein